MVYWVIRIKARVAFVPVGCGRFLRMHKRSFEVSQHRCNRSVVAMVVIDVDGIEGWVEWVAARKNVVVPKRNDQWSSSSRAP